MKTFFILSLLLTVARFQEIPRCEMAIHLTFHQLDGHLDLTLAQWVCNALYIPEREYEKGTRMQSTVRSEIQMKRNSPNGCGRRCNEFINNNLADSILHSKRVVIPQGRISKRHLRYDCENMDLTHFLDDCDLQMDYTIADTKVKSGD